MLSTASELNTTTVFDEQIAELEGQKIRLEAELSQLQQGLVKTTLPGGEEAIVNLQALNPEKLKQHLTEQNQLFQKLTETEKKKHELKKELGLEVALTNNAGVMGLHRITNQAIRSKSKTLGAVLGSRWLLVPGFLILAIWAGPTFLYNATGGTLGGSTPPRARIITTRPAGITPSLTPLVPTTSPAPVGKVAVFYLKQEGDETTPAPEPTKTEGPNGTPEATTPVPLPTTSPINYTGRVGLPPSDAAGLNGPHGTFLAPSRLSILALKLNNLAIERAITEEGEANAGIKVNWPRPGEGIAHYGAYPGELGNMLLLGTQESLGLLRRLQQNDLITLYDRNGNIFSFRTLAFSASGQPEREIDLTNPADNWIWQNTQEAILTILVSYPRSEPINNTINKQLAPSSTTHVTDDYLTTKKLAYRAVLVRYNPAQLTTVGIPVGVPASVWQVSPNPVPATPTISPASPTPAATTTSPTGSGATTPIPVGGQYPGLPNTGDGWCSSHHCDPEGR